MASVIDSIRSVQSDKFALIKLGAFSYLIFLIYKLFMPNVGFNVYNFIIFLLILLFYLGFASIIISNRINQKIETLPTLNLNLFVEVAIKALGISLPFVIGSIIIVNMVINMFNFESLPQQIAIWLIRLCVFSAFGTAFINFSAEYNVKKALNFTKIMEGLADVLVYTLIALLVIVLTCGLIAGPVLYTIYTFFKFGGLFEYTATFFATMSIAILADYWGQLHYDMSSKDKYY